MSRFQLKSTGTLPEFGQSKYISISLIGVSKLWQTTMLKLKVTRLKRKSFEPNFHERFQPSIFQGVFSEIFGGRGFQALGRLLEEPTEEWDHWRGPSGLSREESRVLWKSEVHIWWDVFCLNVGLRVQSETSKTWYFMKTGQSEELWVMRNDALELHSDEFY